MKKRISTFLAIALKSTKFIKLIKAVKLLKPMLSIFTMTLSMMAYSFAYGLIIGVGLTLLIFLHEIGHVIAMKKQGYKVSLPVFIPFLGAVIFAPKFDDRHKEAYVGMGGPLFGTITSLIPFSIFFITNNQIFLFLAYIGVFLNLFNMIPISPLDGGRITQAISKHFKWVGIAALLLFTLSMKDAGMILIWIIVVLDMNIKRKQKMIYANILLALMLIFGFGLGFSHSNTTLWVDVILGAVFVLLPTLGYVFYKNKIEPDDEVVKDDRQLPPLKVRLNWLISYFVLLAAQVALLNYIYQFIIVK